MADMAERAGWWQFDGIAHTDVFGPYGRALQHSGAPPRGRLLWNAYGR